MTERRLVNVEASIRQRLLNLSKTSGEDYGFALTRYANERFLYRLSKSVHTDRFILKGGTLILTWTEELHRPTRDIDFLGLGDDYDDDLINMVKDVCAVPVDPDGLVFNTGDMQVTEIRADDEYQGKRVNFSAILAGAKIYLQLDIGFGDAVIPGIEEIEYPTMLESPAPRLRAYPKETVIAEKLETMVRLGMVNSRMKDFYDVWMMSKVFTFDGYVLQAAIKATFNRRRTSISRTIPIALMCEFAEDKDHIKQWNAFIKRNSLDIGDAEFDRVIEGINLFLSPIISATAAGLVFRKTWPAGGLWNDAKNAQNAENA